MNDDPVDVDRIIHSRRFRMVQHQPGWELPLNDGHTIAKINPLDARRSGKRIRFVDGEPVGIDYGGVDYRKGWGVWLAALPPGWEQEGWRSGDLDWAFEAGPFGTRREAMAYALTLGS